MKAETANKFSAEVHAWAVRIVALVPQTRMEKLEPRNQWCDS
jgi:hypothetical protein